MRSIALYARILELPRPVLAALDGPAIGGGLQLAIRVRPPDRRARRVAARRADPATGSRSPHGACRRSSAAAARSTSA